MTAFAVLQTFSFKLMTISGHEEIALTVDKAKLEKHGLTLSVGHHKSFEGSHTQPVQVHVALQVSPTPIAEADDSCSQACVIHRQRRSTSDGVRDIVMAQLLSMKHSLFFGVCVCFAIHNFSTKHAPISDLSHRAACYLHTLTSASSTCHVSCSRAAAVPADLQSLQQLQPFWGSPVEATTSPAFSSCCWCTYTGL